MLALLNPTLPIMSDNCCNLYPWCSHPRHSSADGKAPTGLGVALGSTWESSMATPYETQYSYAPPPEAVTYASETSRGLHPSPGIHLSDDRAWTPDARLGNDYTGHHWSSAHSTHPDAPYFNGYDYAASGPHYPPHGLRDHSPSRTTDLSGVSMSSHSSPVTSTAHSNYEYMGKIEDRPSYPPLSSVLDRGMDSMIKQESGSYQLRSSHSESVYDDSDSKQKHRKARDSEIILCQICLKTFDRRSNYKSHCEIHEKDRQRVKCKEPDCNKTFGRPAEMTRHYNSTHKHRSFTCDACHKDFTRNDIVIRHRSDACPAIHHAKSGSRRRRKTESQD